jgi:hypothetical protein
MTSNRRAAERRSSLAAAAADIAHEVHGLASYARDGGMYWRQPSAPGEVTGRPRQLDSYLYPGAMGIGTVLSGPRQRSRSAINRPPSIHNR